MFHKTIIAMATAMLVACNQLPTDNPNDLHHVDNMLSRGDISACVDPRVQREITEKLNTGEPNDIDVGYITPGEWNDAAHQLQDNLGGAATLTDFSVVSTDPKIGEVVCRVDVTVPSQRADESYPRLRKYTETYTLNRSLGDPDGFLISVNLDQENADMAYAIKQLALDNKIHQAGDAQNAS